MVRPRVGQGVEVHVPATTANVGPGFDCLGAALDLDNVFQMRCIEGGSERFDLIIEGTEGAHLRGGPDNLVYRSAQRVWKEAGEEPVALEARVRLAVPPARGLGSSATAIVAGLIGANALVGEPLSREKLLELASHRWRVVRCEWSPLVQAVVAIPAIRLTTSEARRAMPKSIPVGDAVINLGSLTLLLQGLRTGNGDLITDGMHDRLHEPYRWGLIHGGKAVREAALAAGAWGCVISGAGPSLLALCPKPAAENVSRAMVRAWHQAGVESRSEVLAIQQLGSRWEHLPDQKLGANE